MQELLAHIHKTDSSRQTLLIPAVESNIQVESMQEKSQVGKVSSAVNHSPFHIPTAAHHPIMNYSSIQNAQAILKPLHSETIVTTTGTVMNKLSYCIDGVWSN